MAMWNLSSSLNSSESDSFLRRKFGNRAQTKIEHFCRTSFGRARWNLAQWGALVRSRSFPILVNFGPLLREQKFSTANSSHISCRMTRKFGTIMGLANGHLFPEFGELFREQKSCTADVWDIFVVARPHFATLGVLMRSRSYGIVVNFGPVSREHKFSTADISHTSFWTVVKFGTTRGLANWYLFPEFHEICSGVPQYHIISHISIRCVARWLCRCKLSVHMRRPVRR